MDGKTFVVLRPPATTANYHSAKSDELLNAILSQLLQEADVFTAIIPRTLGQAAELKAAILALNVANKSYLILENAVDGLNLAYGADLLISGGGTMNREAALLGVPVYSIFAGRQGALDAQMEAEGLIRFVRDEADVAKIELKPRTFSPDTAHSNSLTNRVESFVIDQINACLG
jgi:uncharacterized protein